MWRCFTGKPVRRFRRTLKRFKHTYSRQKGYGKQRGFLWTHDDTQAFFQKKGKGKGKGTRKGKAKGKGKAAANEEVEGEEDTPCEDLPYYDIFVTEEDVPIEDDE